MAFLYHRIIGRRLFASAAVPILNQRNADLFPSGPGNKATHTWQTLLRTVAPIHQTSRRIDDLGKFPKDSCSA